MRRPALRGGRRPGKTREARSARDAKLSVTATTRRPQEAGVRKGAAPRDRVRCHRIVDGTSAWARQRAGRSSTALSIDEIDRPCVRVIAAEVVGGSEPRTTPSAARGAPDREAARPRRARECRQRMPIACGSRRASHGGDHARVGGSVSAPSSRRRSGTEWIANDPRAGRRSPARLLHLRRGSWVPRPLLLLLASARADGGGGSSGTEARGSRTVALDHDDIVDVDTGCDLERRGERRRRDLESTRCRTSAGHGRARFARSPEFDGTAPASDARQSATSTSQLHQV